MPFIFKIPYVAPFFSEILKATASNANSGDNLGFAVSIDGDVAVIGALFADPDGVSNAGAAYVYEYNGTDWIEVQILIASDKSASDRLGTSVSVKGTTIVVGAIASGTAGAAYVYEKSGGAWPATETAKLTPSDGTTNDEFGGSIAIDSTTIIVGAQQNDPDGLSNAGAAYVFEKAGTWPANETAKLTASDKSIVVWHGYSVAIDGNTIIVGALDGGSADNGVYVYEKSGTWPATETQKLVASDGVPYFGAAVAIEGTRIVVGAYNSTQDGVSAAGSAYIFEKSGTWIETQKLTASNKSVNARFGYDVGLSGNSVVVGARDADAAYIFEKGGTWTETQILTASDGVSGWQFGQRCDISGTKVTVGAPSTDVPFVDVGAAYFFSK